MNPGSHGFRFLIEWVFARQSVTYEPFITSGGDEIDVEFNVLSPSDVRNGIGDWIADALLEGG